MSISSRATPASFPRHHPDGGTISSSTAAASGFVHQVKRQPNRARQMAFPRFPRWILSLSISFSSYPRCVGPRSNQAGSPSCKANDNIPFDRHGTRTKRSTNTSGGWTPRRTSSSTTNRCPTSTNRTWRRTRRTVLRRLGWSHASGPRSVDELSDLGKAAEVQEDI